MKNESNTATTNKLNELFSVVQSTDKKLQEAYDQTLNALMSNDELVRHQKAAKAAMAAFELEKKRIGSVKFDTSKGEYFPAKNADGTENFRIRITESREVVVPIAATSVDDAYKQALKMVDEGKVYLFSKPTEAMDVSTMA